MPNNLIDRLRSAANAIDERSGDYELRCLLLEAAGAIDDALSMRLQIANRLPLEMLADGKCDTWSGTLSAVHRLKTERNNALAEVDDLSAKEADYCNHIVEVDKKVYQLQAQNEKFRRGCEELFAINMAHLLHKIYAETPEQTLADIQALAVEAFKDELVKSVKFPFQIHIEGVCAVVTQRMRAGAKETITNPPETSSQLVDGASNRQFDCWSCRITVTNSDVSEADGLCPHCDAEIFCDD